MWKALICGLRTIWKLVFLPFYSYLLDPFTFSGWWWFGALFGGVHFKWWPKLKFQSCDGFEFAMALSGNSFFLTFVNTVSVLRHGIEVYRVFILTAIIRRSGFMWPVILRWHYQFGLATIMIIISFCVASEWVLNLFSNFIIASNWY